jgi:hypothetical protein
MHFKNIKINSILQIELIQFIITNEIVFDITRSGFVIGW